MVPLSVIGAAITAQAAGFAPPPAVARWQPLIAEASRRFGVPAPWIARVIAAESGGRMSLNGTPIRSPAGAIGLMQLMPATWQAMQNTYGLGPDPDDPRDNILAGTGFLRLMYDRFGYPGLFAAYNAGPARYAASLRFGAPLPPETLVYLARVTGDIAAAPAASEQDLSQGLFVLRHDAPPTASAKPASPEPSALFAVRRVTP